MKQPPMWPVLCILAAWPLSAQREAVSPAFEVASVKPHSQGNPLGTMMQELPGKIQYRKITLLAVIRRAHHVQSEQIAGPDWLRTETYDLEAKLPPDTPDARLQLMLQNLLAERFHLKVHHGKGKLPAYDLVLAKEASRCGAPKTAVWDMPHRKTAQDATFWAGSHCRFWPTTSRE